jgi:hypothetical protein
MTRVPTKEIHEFMRALLGRADDKEAMDVCEQWLPEHMRDKSINHMLSFQTLVICELVDLYELASRSGVIATAALLFEKNPAMGREHAAEQAKGMIQQAGQHIQLSEVDAGPAQ